MTKNIIPIRLSKHQIEPAAKVFARTFYNDNVYSHFIPDSYTRSELSPYIFEFMIRYGFLYGEVHASSEKLEAISILVKSNRSKMSNWGKIRASGKPFNIDNKIRKKLKTFNAHVLTMHKKIAPFPHTHLYFLAVDPVYQCKGYGTLMMKNIIKNLDNENIPCYLETFKKRNAEFYLKFEFKIVETVLVPETNIQHFCMLRN